MLGRSNSSEESAHQDGELIRYGVIASVIAGGFCTVSIGDLVTGPIRWFAPRAGKTRHWSKASEGEQVMLFCPEGDVEAGCALLGVWSDDFPPPSDEDVELIQFEDGAVLSYDPVAHALKAILPAGGTVELEATGGISIKGDVTIDGAVQITGDVGVAKTLTAQTDVFGGGKSLKTHKHLQVQPGSGVSGIPQ